MIILDEVIKSETQTEIKKILLSDSFPWYYKNENTVADEKNNNPCVSHFFINNGVVNSYYSNIINLLVTDSYEKLPSKILKKFSYISFARSFLQFPLHTNFCNVRVDPLHVDCNFEHYVLLYYVIDSDGDTIITKTKYNKNKQVSLKLEDHQEAHRITPKQGRVVLFDGSYYHTAEQPFSNVRCIINIDLVKPV